MIRQFQRLVVGDREIQTNSLFQHKRSLLALLSCFICILSFGNSNVFADSVIAGNTAEFTGELKEVSFLGIPLWDDDLYKLIVRFSFDLFFLSLVVGVAYSSNNKKNQRYIFNFLIMNIVVFFICFTLKKLELELGMALGLFAIFAIIRYRTDQIDVKDMTYLFVAIGLAVINSLSNKKTSYVELVFTNTAIFFACLFLERFMGQPVKKAKSTRSEIIYDKIDLLRPENVQELHEDLYQRTGIRVERVEVKQIDFQNSTSLLDVRQAK